MTPDDVLFITLDSCRFDTFESARAPNLKAVAPLHRAQAPSYFTYASHSAMFVGFTPGLAGAAQPFLDPKFGKLFKIVGAGHAGKGTEGFELSGRNIVEGFANRGHTTIGTAAMGWFDPATATGAHLTDAFHHFHFAGPYHLRSQLSFVEERLAAATGPTFTFLNIGETHVPYWHEGAPWSADDNPCHPFQTVDRSAECRTRQRACLEFVDRELAPLLHRHLDATILVCGDHGDCWGEDGLWEHGIAHEKTLTVPLLIRYQGGPVADMRRPAPGRWGGLSLPPSLLPAAIVERGEKLTARPISLARPPQQMRETLKPAIEAGVASVGSDSYGTPILRYPSGGGNSSAAGTAASQTGFTFFSEATIDPNGSRPTPSLPFPRIGLAQPVFHVRQSPGGTWLSQTMSGVGSHAMLMNNIRVGNGAVIAARAVVSKDVPPYAIVAGNPARVVRYRFDEATVDDLLRLAWWNWPKDRIERHMRLMLSDDVRAFIDAARTEEAAG